MSDALSSILEAVRIRGTVYFWASFGAPWGVRVPQFASVVRYHIVLRGSCYVQIEGEAEPVLLQAGDMIAIPHGRSHTLSDAPDSPTTTLDRLLQKTSVGPGRALVIPERDRGLHTRLVCGHFAHDGDVDHPLFRLLPSLIVVRGVTTR